MRGRDTDGEAEELRRCDGVDADVTKDVVVVVELHYWMGGGQGEYCSCGSAGVGGPLR